jgi:hypothetical protein
MSKYMDREQETISLASVVSHTESLRQEVRHSKSRTLFALLASTFLLVMWFGALTNGKPFTATLFARYLIAAPAVFNTLAWFLWFIPTVQSLVRGLFSTFSRRFSAEDVNTSFLIEQYQLTQRQHSIQTSRAARVEVLLAVQFITAGVYAANYLYYWIGTFGY